MDENYRLVFRGEVLDDQHPAVVKKRLVDALKLSDAQAERLFSGNSIVIKQSADPRTAARYQGVFKRAGARLRVLPVEPEALSSGPGADGPVDANSKPGPGQGARLQIQPEPVAARIAPAPEIDAPEFSVAELGSNMVEPRVFEPLDLEVDFQLAEVGEPIPQLVKEAVAINLDDVQFEVAEVGANMADARPAPSAVAPDVSHLSLVD